MSEAQSSDAMKNLAFLMIGLAVVGAIIGLAFYFALVLPVHHAALLPPANS